MTLSTGEQIGQYTIEDRIGSGGMATVYKAYHARLDRHVAIKVMHPSFLEDPTFRSRFEREAKIVARLDHPNIVPVFDFDDYEKQPFLVMKFVEGRTLKEVMRTDGGLAPEEVKRIMRKTADALTYAHQMGILHRDIKPSNIIIDSRGEPHLMDFGLARIAQSGESTMSADMMLGTPQYISPEQAQGKTDLTAHTDIYSLGIILYELLVGRVPFMSDSTYAIVHDHIYTPLPLPSDIKPSVSREVENVLLKALAKNPNERYATPTAMIDDYLRADAGQAIEVVRGRVTPRPSRPMPIPPKPPKSPQVSTNQKLSTDFSILPPMPPLLPRPGDTRSFEQRMDDYGKQMEQWGKNIERRFNETSDDDHTNNIGTMHWRPGTTWRTDALGNQGFFTDDEIEEQFHRMPTDQQIRARVEKRMKARYEVFGHLAAYILINAMLWMIYFMTDPGGHPWPIYVTMGWGIGMFFHTMDYYVKFGGGQERREERVRREVERERQRHLERSQVSKVKNEDLDYDRRSVRLTEDGELTESFIEEIDEHKQQRKR